MSSKDKNKVIIDLSPLKGTDMSFVDVVAYLGFKYREETEPIYANPEVMVREYNINKRGYDYYYNPDLIELMEKCISVPERITQPEDFYMYHLDEVATELKALFPKGKKTSSVLWTDSVPLIKKRLQLFNNKYPGYYSKEQVIQATKRYVDSFNGVHTHMRALKYFIFKNDVKGGEVEQTSDLLNYLEDDSTEIMNNNDWTAELV